MLPVIRTPADARRVLRLVTLRDVPVLRIIGRANTLSEQLRDMAASVAGVVPDWRET